jgi:hypothetical protein
MPNTDTKRAAVANGLYVLADNIAALHHGLLDLVKAADDVSDDLTDELDIARSLFTVLERQLWKTRDMARAGNDDLSEVPLPEEV